MKTRRILSAVLAIALVLTSSVGVFGAESQNEGEYNSLKLPVINEIQPTDENGEISLMSALWRTAHITMENTASIYARTAALNLYRR